MKKRQGSSLGWGIDSRNMVLLINAENTMDKTSKQQQSFQENKDFLRHIMRNKDLEKWTLTGYMEVSEQST